MSRVGGAGLMMAVAAVGCGATGLGTGPSTGEPLGSVAFTGARVLDLDRNRLDNGQTIVVVDGRIAALGPDGTVAIPEGITRRPLVGQVVMAPLADMHVHGLTEGLGVYLGFGIGTVRVMWGTPGQSSLAELIRRGDTVGPTIISASPGHDGRPASWPLTRFVETPDEAGPAVARVAAEQWSFLKVYDRLPLEAYRALLVEANRRAIPVVGHVPFAVPLADALALGQRSIEHLSGFEGALDNRPGPNATRWASIDRSRMPELARAVAQSDSWICPTTAVARVLADRNWPELAPGIVAGRRAMVKALYDARARLLVGTDAGINVVPPGRSLLSEFEEFVAAGVPPSAVLRMATRGAAEFLGRNDAGLIAPGAAGELLFLRGDPRADLSLLLEPTGLLVAGRLYSAEALRSLRVSGR